MMHLLRAHLCLGLALVVAGCSGDPATRRQRHYDKGVQFAQQGKCREAVVEFRNAVQIDPRFGPARAKLAECYGRLGDGTNALKEYVRAADLLPSDAAVQVSAGQYLLLARQPQEALTRADAALKLRPDNVDAHVLRGNALGGINDLASALNEIEEAIRLDPARGTTYTHLALLKLAGGNRAEAEAAFAKAVELAPKAIGTHLALANFYWASGDFVKAESAFKTALTLEPENPTVNRALAAFSIASNRRDDGEKYLKKVLDITKSPAAVFALADFYLATGQAPRAVELLKPLTDRERAVPGAKHRLVQALALQGDRAGANTLADELVKTNQRDADAQLLKGSLQLDEGKREDALTSVRAAVDADPASARAQFMLGRLYRERGDFSAAEAAFKEVLRLNPHASAAQAELSRLHLASGSPKESLRFAEEAARREPNSLEARVTLVRSLLASKDFIRAEREVDVLLNARPNFAPAHVYKGVIAGERKDRAAARASFERAIALDPRSLEAVGGLIALDLASQDRASARARVDAMMAGGSPSPEQLLLAARTYGTLGDGQAAERTLRRAIDLDPTRLPPYAMLAQLYLGQRRLDEARKEFETIAQRQVRPVGALTMAGIILQSQGDNAQARQRFERALSIDPRAAVAANNLAWMYVESGENLDAALQLARSAVAEQPDTPAMMDTLGWVYYKKSQAELAVPLLSRCVAKEPSNPVYHFHLGLAQVAAGNPAAGRRALARALELRADFAGADEARRVLAGLEPATGR